MDSSHEARHARGSPPVATFEAVYGEVGNHINGNLMEINGNQWKSMEIKSNQIKKRLGASIFMGNQWTSSQIWLHKRLFFGCVLGMVLRVHLRPRLAQN